MSGIDLSMLPAEVREVVEVVLRAADLHPIGGAVAQSVDPDVLRYAARALAAAMGEGDSDAE